MERSRRRLSDGDDRTPTELTGSDHIGSSLVKCHRLAMAQKKDQQQYYDYLEMADGPGGTTSPEPPSTPFRASWLTAIGVTLMLMGAALGTATFWPFDKHGWQPWKVEFEAGEQAAPEQVVVTGNRVAITFTNDILLDGRIAWATISVRPGFRASPPRWVEISSPSIRCSFRRFYFDANFPRTLDQRVACRSSGSSVHSNSGTRVRFDITFTYNPELKVRPEKQTVNRELLSAGRCSAWGDPHLTTFDGVQYDFMAPGVFRYLETRNFLVQVFQEPCPPGRKGKNVPACYQGFSIAYADSVLRFFLENNTITVAKGSDELKWLEVAKLGGKTQGYRVFPLVDQSAYIDVTMGIWVNNYGYLNIAVQASPFLRDDSLVGLMGNWNGNQADDVRDRDQLVAAHGFSLTENLFTCDGDSCSKWLKPATTDDEDALLVPNDEPRLRNGYTTVNSTDIPKRAFTPRLPPAILAMATELDEEPAEAQPDIAARAYQLCNDAINSVPLCNKYVPNSQFFVFTVCLVDAINMGDLSVVDQTKLSYLRECRGVIESRLTATEDQPTEHARLEADRATLEFGDLSQCPKECNGHGDCLAAGCGCHAGYTGYTCEIEI
ncbi:hypothetical protein ATCC90586_004805 [Pythium insidiosum]|nr:hypothetical protein ATCC90586_004805 [Pythium insidiosum]